MVCFFFLPFISANSKLKNFIFLKTDNNIQKRIIKGSEHKKIHYLHARPLQNVLVEFHAHNFQKSPPKTIRKFFKMPLITTKPEIIHFSGYKTDNLILIYPKGKPWFKSQS